MENLKISEMLAKTPNNLDDVILPNRYWIPAYLSNDNDKNGRLDLGQMFSLFKGTIAKAVSDEIAARIEAGQIGTGSGSGQSEGGQGGSSSDIQALSTTVANLKVEVDRLSDKNNWPKHFIRLVSGSTFSDYTLSTSPGDPSSSNENNPIVIETTSVDLPNFYVTLEITTPSYENRKINVGVYYTISSVQGSIRLKGGTIGEVVIKGSFKIGSSEYTFNSLTIDLSGTTLGTENTTTGRTQVTLQSENTFDNNPGTISTAGVTCSVSGVELLQTAYHTSQGQGGNNSTVSGQIRIPANGS